MVRTPEEEETVQRIWERAHKEAEAELAAVMTPGLRPKGTVADAVRAAASEAGATIARRVGEAGLRLGAIADPIPVGGVARLASGGPSMTVCYHHDSDHSVTVRWFVGDELMTDIFPAAALRKL